jgi:hypothetical protein
MGRSQGTTSITFPATMGNTHSYFPGMPIPRLFSDTFPAISQSGPVSCDAPPTATYPTCRANDSDVLSPTPSAIDLLNLSARFPVKEEAATGIAHNYILDHSRTLYSTLPRSSRPAFPLRAPLIRGELNERLLSVAALSGHDWEWSTLPVPEISPKRPHGVTPRSQSATGGDGNRPDD